MKKRHTFNNRLGSMRNKILIAVAVVVGLSSIAYAAYAKTVTISGTGTATGVWNVGINSITLSDSDGATENSAPTHNGTTANFDVNLAFPGAFAEYTVVVKNSGNIPAMLDTITDLTSKNAETPTYINYSVSGVTAHSSTLGTDADVDDTNTITVRIEWPAGTSPDTSSNNSKSATINFDYIQNTN